MNAATLTSRASGALVGRARAPGDKSISHRALILGALAHGVTDIEGAADDEVPFLEDEEDEDFGEDEIEGLPGEDDDAER